jgi:hypothetical protein
MKEEDGSLGAEVSSRLDELFGDEDAPASPVSGRSVAAEGAADDSRITSKKPERPLAKAGVEEDLAEDSPIRNLKALVFSIDWEITDETMVDFLAETDRLLKRYQNDKILTLFLKLHESIGKYIKARKARAHPDAIKFVASVYKNFEKVLLTPNMNENQKKQLLAMEVNKFKDFKERVLSREAAGEPVAEAAAPARTPSPAPVAAESQATGPLSKEALDYIVEQIKKEIKAEFHTLRQIIKNLGA